MFAKIAAQSSASILLHGLIVLAVLVFSSEQAEPIEQVYRVTLAEFSAPAAAPSAVPSMPELPLPEAVQQERPATPPIPEAVVTPPKPQTKTISTKKEPRKTKEKTPEVKPVATPPPPAPSNNTASTAEARGNGSGTGTGGPGHSIGGLAAYDVDTVDQRPSISRRVVPEYPQKARRMSVQGKVFVRLVVDTSGAPKSCSIHKADPAGYFEEAALAAARKTRFIPGKVKGQPVNTIVLIPFVFALR